MFCYLFSNTVISIKDLADPVGFEPTTWWSEATRTIQAMQRVQFIKKFLP